MKSQKILTLTALALIAVLLSGCALLDGLKLFKNDDQETQASEDEVVLEQELDLTGATEAVPEADENAGDTPESETSSLPPEDARRVVLYFASADGGLETESRDIPQQEGIARATVNELIAGPQSAGLKPTLPSTAIVEGMTVSDGECTVDFSSELVDHLSAESDAQKLAVYSVVNTLTQFDSVDRVRILVDGETVPGGLGGVDLSAALAPAEL